MCWSSNVIGHHSLSLYNRLLGLCPVCKSDQKTWNCNGSCPHHQARSRQCRWQSHSFLRLTFLSLLKFSAIVLSGITFPLSFENFGLALLTQAFPVAGKATGHSKEPWMSRDSLSSILSRSLISFSWISLRKSASP